MCDNGLDAALFLQGEVGLCDAGYYVETEEGNNVGDNWDLGTVNVSELY